MGFFIKNNIGYNLILKKQTLSYKTGGPFHGEADIISQVLEKNTWHMLCVFESQVHIQFCLNVYLAIFLVWLFSQS